MYTNQLSSISGPAFGPTSRPAFGPTSRPAFGPTSRPGFDPTLRPGFGSGPRPGFIPTSGIGVHSNPSEFGSTGFKTSQPRVQLASIKDAQEACGDNGVKSYNNTTTTGVGVSDNGFGGGRTTDTSFTCNEPKAANIKPLKL